MQAELIAWPDTRPQTVFLSGPAGSGKTTFAVSRLYDLLGAGVPGEQVLVLVPQRTLAAPFYEALHNPRFPAGTAVDVATLGGLARRTIDLFWPFIAGAAGFSEPGRPPRFLTLETTQYHMERVLEPFVSSGAFDGVTIPRSRLVSQNIDNLNKAAAVGFPIEEIAARFKESWAGESARLRVFDQVQAVAETFRRTCLDHNLLDWSLQIEVFQKHLLPLPACRRYLLSGYRHLIADNIEEDVPAVHDLLAAWLGAVESALLVYDTDGGYRVFLAADPEGAWQLRELCNHRLAVQASYVAPPEMVGLTQSLAGRSGSHDTESGRSRDALVLPPRALRFHPQMLDWVAEEASRLVWEEGILPGDLAILAPFLSDALRFALTERLGRFGLAVRTHRPSRELREEPAARCLLTLVKLAHPDWRRPPPVPDVAHALTLAITDMDPVRARLLTDVVYRTTDGAPMLAPFHQIIPETQQRISYLLGGRYTVLHEWLMGNLGSADQPDGLEHLLSRLFSEVLAQPGHGFHRNLDAGAVAANLIESVRKFRQGHAPGAPAAGSPGLALEYVDLVDKGVVAAQYVGSWQVRPEQAILLVPAYTFLMMNHPVTVQFWLDAGSLAWYERLFQPLTHPFVLRRDWPRPQVWSDADEVRVRDLALERLVLGLGRRCRRSIYLAYSELSEGGFEQQGPLLQAVQRMLRQQQGRLG